MPAPAWRWLNKLITRRTLLFGAAAAASPVVAAASLYGYSRHVAPFQVQVRRERMTIRGLAAARPVRIAHLSDLHWSPDVPDEILIRAFDLTLAEKPDLVCITGDFVTEGQIYRTGYPRLLRRLTDHVPTLASMGNHDGGGSVNRAGSGAVRRVLAEGGLRVLHNASHTVEVAGGEIEFVGLGDIWAHECQPLLAFQHTKTEPGPRLVLSHNPDSKKAAAPYRWDLLLSGHTHGGQVVPPLLGPIFAPVADGRYIHGLKCWEDRWINVTSGVGSILGVRFNCPPEVVVLELSRAEGY